MSVKNEMMKVHPQIIHSLDTSGLSVLERRVFKVLSWMLRDAGSALVTISFEDFRRLLGKDHDPNTEPAKLVPLIERTYKKILAVPFRIETEDKIQVFNVFYGFEIDKKNQTVSIAVNEPWTYLFTNVTPNAYYELIEYQGLSSGYAQVMYELMKDFRKIGRFYESGNYKLHDPSPIGEFRAALGVPATYDMKQLNQRVLAPIERELSPIFKNFRIEKIHSGRKVIALRFTWKPEPAEYKNRLSDDQRELGKVNRVIQESFASMELAEQYDIRELKEEAQTEFLNARDKKKTLIEKIFGKNKKKK